MPIRSIFVISDLEGSYAVQRFSETRRKGRSLEKARKDHTEQLNVMIRSIRDFDKSIDIHVWDSHGCGGLCRDTIDKVEAFISPGNIDLLDYFHNARIDALFFESAHAMAGTPNANLCHTMSSRRVKRFVLNGAEIGEIGLRAAMAGTLTIPVFYINGDDKACEEARKIMPWIITTVTKHGISTQKAHFIPKEKVFDTIYKDVQEAIKNGDTMKAYSISGPIELKIDLKTFYSFIRRMRRGFGYDDNTIFKTEAMKNVVAQIY